MRILIHDFGAYPFSVQLARELARRDHTVRYVYLDEPGSVRGEVRMKPGDPANFTSIGIASPSAEHRKSLARRVVHDCRYGALLVDETRAFQPDLVLSADCPIFSQSMVKSACQESGATFVFWLQDLFGLALQAVISRRNKPLGRLLSKPARVFENRILRTSDQVLAISPSFVDYVRDFAKPDGDVHLLPNWAPLPPVSLTEDTTKADRWGAAQGLPDGPRLLYSGTLGLKHEPSILSDLAIHLQATGGHVVVVSEGAGREHLEEIKSRQRIPNLYLLDFQPIGDVPAVLESADVLLAILNEDASKFSAPSKILSYLSVGRPVLCVMPSDNFAAEVIAKAGAGVTVSATDRTEVCEIAERLIRRIDLREKMGQNGKAFAEREFQVDRIADRMLAMCGADDAVVDLQAAEIPTTNHRKVSPQS